MKIWKCKAEQFKDGKLVELEKSFDDSEILLDCVCETYDEMIDYMIHVCRNWCRSEKVRFVAFEIIAE